MAMTTILILNAVSAGTAIAGLIGLRLRRRRRHQHVYVTVDGRHVTRDEPA